MKYFCWPLLPASPSTHVKTALPTSLNLSVAVWFAQITCIPWGGVEEWFLYAYFILKEVTFKPHYDTVGPQNGAIHQLWYLNNLKRAETLARLFWTCKN